MTNPAVTLTIEAEIAHLSFDDGKANVLNPDSFKALEQALDKAKASKALIISGREGIFSGGLDLKTLPKLSKEELHSSMQQFKTLCQSLLTYPCPTIAAVTGHAIAGGAVVMLCCEHRIGKGGAYNIGLPEVAMNMPLPSFVIELARRSVKRRFLAEVVLEGKTFSPSLAKEVGLLSSLATSGECLEAARQMAEKLERLPNPAYTLTKKRMAAGILSSLEAFEEELKYFTSQFNWESVSR